MAPNSKLNQLINNAKRQLKTRMTRSRITRMLTDKEMEDLRYKVQMLEAQQDQVAALRGVKNPSRTPMKPLLRAPWT